MEISHFRTCGYVEIKPFPRQLKALVLDSRPCGIAEITACFREGVETKGCFL